MSHLNPGLLAAYNSLTDRHLTGYFNNARIRRHLQKVGLITRSGRIVPDKEYKHRLIQRAHQRHVRECLAQAIFHKVLDMERLHQSEIKRKLEEFARRERIHKMKTERSRRYDEEPMLMLSPRPPTGPKISHARHSGPEGENSESTESPSSSRPNTAPGKMQRPVRLKPLNSNSATASLKRTSPRYRLRDRDSSNDTDQPLSYMLDRDTVRHTTLTDFSSTVSPYRLPVINNYVTPVPPLTKKKERGTRANGTHRGRKLRPTTAPTATEPPAFQRSSAQSKVSVGMVYFGKSVHLSHDLMDLRDEVKVFQQHCGGENLCVFKGKLREGEMFQFVSRRHQGFPFSLTFFLNGLQVDRLSSCCEFKYRKGARLGGRHGHFGFCGVEGASPCYKCIIAMGLDKKPTPPLKRVKEELPTSKSPDAKEATDVDEDIETPSNTEPHASQEMETDHNGQTAEKKKLKDDYEEDFEADDEGPVEDGEEVEEKPSSVVNDGEKEIETRAENDINEKNRASDSEVEDANMSKIKRSSSVSFGRMSSLSSNDSDNSDREIEEDTKEVTAANVLKESLHTQPEEDLTAAQTKMEATESSSVTLPLAAEEDSATQDSPVDSMEKSEFEMSEDTEKKEHSEGEEAGEEVKPEDKPQEPEATSIQKKLAEAILKESQCSSDPEFSDTSTEEDEGASVKTQQDSQGAEMECASGLSSPQAPNAHEDIPEDKAKTQEAAHEETSHADDETGQPAEETNTGMSYAHKEEKGEQSKKNEEMTASLNIEEKQEVEELEKTKEVERQDEKEELPIETESNIEGGSQEVQEEAKDEAVEANTEPKEEEMFESVQEPETHDQTLDTGNTGNEDTTMMGDEVSEMDKESEIEKEGSVSHNENDIETGVADSEKKTDTDDAHQNVERRSNGQPHRDERDDLTDEAGDDRSTGEKVQDTDGMVYDGGSVGKQESGEKSSGEKENSAEEDVIDGVEKKEDKNVSLQEVAEKLESEDKSKDLEVEDVGEAIDGEIHAVEKENEVEGGKDLKEEDKEHEESTEREDRLEVGEAESEKNEGGQDLKAEDTEKENYVEREGESMHDGQNETEAGEQGRNKPSEKEGQESNQHGEDEIVGETENDTDEMMENMGQEEEKETEVEEGKRHEMAEQEGESVQNKEKDMECGNTLETGEKLVEDLKCDEDEAKKEVEDINESGENVEEERDGNKEVISGENVAQKPEDNFIKVLQEEQKEIGSSRVPKDDTEPSIKEEETHPTDVNNDLLASNIDAENGERQNTSHEDVEKVEKHLQDETTVGKPQDVTDDSETKPDTNEDMREEKYNDKEQEIENRNMTETKSEVEVASDRDSQFGVKHNDQGSDNQKVDDKSVAEEADKESETSAKTFIENVAPEKMLDSHDKQEMTNKDAESEIIASAEGEVTTEEPNDIETEPKSTDNDLRSRDAPEWRDSEPEEPLEKKENSVNEEKGGSSMSHSGESQPVEKVLAFKKEEKDLSIDSEDPAIHSAVLDKADGVDLVSNWINIHQASRYFQTFIEPLDEIKENSISDETEKRLNGEGLDATDTTSTDFGGLDETFRSRDEIATPLRSDLNENTGHDTVVESFITETKPKALESDAHSNQSKDDIHSSTKDKKVKEGGENRGSLVTMWSDDDTNQNEMVRQENSMLNNIINLETTEDTTSEKIQDRNPSETKEQDLARTSDLNPNSQEESEQNNQQTITEEITHLSSLSQTEDANDKEILDSSEHNLKSEHVPQSEYIEPQSPTITVITDLTIINKFGNGSQDDTASVDFHSRQLDGSKNTDGNRRTQAIDGHFKQTLSRDTLSTFSLDDSRFFGPAGYPRLTTAHTDNSY